MLIHCLTKILSCSVVVFSAGFGGLQSVANAQVDINEPELTMPDLTMPDVPEAEVLPTEDAKPADGPRVGAFNVILPLPGQTEMSSILQGMAKRFGENVQTYPKRITKELEAANADPALVPTEPPTTTTTDTSEKPMAYAKYSFYVPADYKPGKPYGLIAFINAGEGSGGVTSYREALDKQHMIFVGAHNVGNKNDTVWRFLLTLEAVRNAKEMYDIDDDRVYVSGFSGGGRASSIMAMTMPDVFTGGFHFSGVNYFRNVPSEGGKFWSGYSPKLDQKVFNTSRQRSRFVLQTGSKDSNLKNTKEVYDAFKVDRFNVLYLEVPDHGHAMPPADAFATGVAFLDAPIFSKASELYKQAQASEKKKKFGEAYVAYARATVRGSDQPFAKEAAASAEKLQAMYTNAVQETRALIDAGDFVKATAAMNQLKLTFAPIADKQAAAFKEEITAAVKKSPKKTPAVKPQ